VMQVQAHSITTRRPPLVCVGTGGGNPSPGRARHPPVAVPPPSGAWGGCRVSGQRTSASDPGAAARGEAEPTKRLAAPQLATAATRSLQPPPRPPGAPPSRAPHTILRPTLTAAGDRHPAQMNAKFADSTSEGAHEDMEE